MSNELIIPNSKPTYLSTAVKSAAADEFLSGVSGGMPLPVISVRGKEFRFRFQGQEQNTRQRELECILVASRPRISKRYYAKQYVSGETLAPDCSSSDGITPDVAEPINDKCATCPKNAWGSKITDSGKEGKACQDYKRLVVLPLIDGKLTDLACVLDVAPMSLKAPKGYRGDELFLREYLNTLTRHDIPPQAAVTKLTFSDAEFPQLTFGFTRFAEEDEFEHAQAMRENGDVQDVLEGATEAPGPISEGQAIPAKDVTDEPAEAKEPEKEPEKKAEPKIFVFNMETDEGKEILESALGKAKAEGFSQVTKAKYDKLMAMAAEDKEEEPKKETKAAPEPEPETKAEPEAAADDDDDASVLDEIKNLLG